VIEVAGLHFPPVVALETFDRTIGAFDNVDATGAGLPAGKPERRHRAV
jgi:hypothetical protein